MSFGRCGIEGKTTLDVVCYTGHGQIFMGSRALIKSIEIRAH